MKFKVKSLDLVGMLKVAVKGYDSRDDSSFIYLKVEDNKLTVVSRCQSAYFSGSVDVENVEIAEDEPHIYYVDGEVLKKLAGIFPTAPINIEFSVNKESRTFVTSYTGSKFKLPITADTKEQPIPAISQLGMIQAPEFMHVLNMLLKIVDNDPSAQEHPSSCLHLIFSSDTIKTMGTDRYALAALTREFVGEGELDGPETVLIKHPQASLLAKTAGPAEVLRIVYSDEYFGYYDGEGNLSLVGRTTISPLNYEAIKNLTGQGNSVVLETSELRNALSTISKLSFAYDAVSLAFNADEKSCKVNSVTGDSISIPVISMDLSDSLNVGFTRSVLAEALIPVSTDELRLEWPDTTDAAVYKVIPLDNGVDEEGVFIGVVPNAD